MRILVASVATAAVMALTGGCSGAGAPATDPPSSSATPDDDVAVADSPACEEVRAGIDAFNLGDFDSTVEHFEAAVPLAEEQDDGSDEAADLVEAVHYYADLKAQDYLEASRSSADFAKYKAITLGQCVAMADSSESPGTDV